MHQLMHLVLLVLHTGKGSCVSNRRRTLALTDDSLALSRTQI